MPNIQQVISNHNRSLIKKNIGQAPPGNDCNCRISSNCPLDGKCLTSSIIYQATVSRQDTQKEETYIGLTENTFKTRFNGHTNSFRHSDNRYATTLSDYIWSLKDDNIPYTLKWKMITKATPYSSSSKICNLCIKEKYFIICKPHMASLNRRNELVAECRHRKKHLLCNVIP